MRKFDCFDALIFSLSKYRRPNLNLSQIRRRFPFSLAVRDRAFAVSKFTSVREIFQAKNRGPVKCTALRWKEEWLKRPVCRQYDEPIVEGESDEGEPDEREYRPLPYHRLLYDMER